jgi:acetate kinase
VTILAINCGSSSLKFGVFDGDTVIRRGHAETIDQVLELVDRPSSVGHRIVHGGPDHAAPVVIDDAVVAALQRAIPFAPLHLPIELAAIDAVRKRFPGVVQVACFDTAFHRTMPAIAYRYALPDGLCDAGLRRYGFHGLSYEYIASVIPTTKRAVFAHLGSGASMVAIRDGVAIDTTMGLTPTGGLVMGTRSGDLDPGVMLYLLGQGYDARSLATLVTHESGLLALSSTTADMQKLLDARAHDPRAALAVDIFCYQAKKWLGSFVAALGGIDMLVFTGGIGEHAPAIRSKICSGMAFSGIELDADLNASNAPAIGGGTCGVRVVATDEEAMIARHTRELALRSGS